jgi:1-acyl-sn-glycerol-3-phosphate acyltransferase
MAEAWRLGPVGDAVDQREFLVAPESGNSAAIEFDTEELRRRAALINREPLISDAVIEARGLFDLQAEGLENIPYEGPVLLLGNNPGAPLFIDVLPVMAHTIYTLDAIAQRRVHPAWTLTTSIYFDIARRSSYVGGYLERLGFVPATEGNGIRLLQMGEAVLAYPEEKPSRPPYGLRPFSPAYLRMALEAGAPIVPVIFMGTHESHLLVEQNGRQILVNKRQRLRAAFRIMFLPEVDVRIRAGRNPSDIALAQLSMELRENMQRIIRAESDKRPLTKLVEHLQRRDLRLRLDPCTAHADFAGFRDDD